MTASNVTRIRPRYNLKTATPPAFLLKELRNQLALSSEIKGKIVDDHVYLCLPKNEQHYWSPELRITITNEDNTTSIRGIAGPNGKVWATFMVFYGLTIMLFIFGGSLGISAWFLGMNASWLWSIPVSFLLYVLIFSSAKYGQKLGRKQLLQLRDFLDVAIKNADQRQNSHF